MERGAADFFEEPTAAEDVEVPQAGTGRMVVTDP